MGISAGGGSIDGVEDGPVEPSEGASSPLTEPPPESGSSGTAGAAGSPVVVPRSDSGSTEER